MRRRVQWVFLIACGAMVAVLATLAVESARSRSRQGERSQHATEPSGENSATVVAGTRALRGTVTARGSGRPIAEARVHLYGDARGPISSTLSDTSGAFRFPATITEYDVVLAAAEGFRPTWLAMRSSAPVHLQLEKGEAYPYQVTNPEGTPIVRARVEVWWPYFLSGHRTRRVVETDDDGAFPVIHRCVLDGRRGTGRRRWDLGTGDNDKPPGLGEGIPSRGGESIAKGTYVIKVQLQKQPRRRRDIMLKPSQLCDLSVLCDEF